MSPFRWDVLGAGFVLALPLLALWLRGDMTVEEMTARLPWCLAAGYGAVALLRFAVTPRTKPAEDDTAELVDVPESEPSPAV